MKNILCVMSNTEAVKPVTITVASLIGLVQETIPFAFVLFVAIVLDCLSAFDLSRRMKKKYPDKVTGKFRSEYALRMLKTFIQMYSVILLMHLVQVYVIPMHKLNLANYTAAVCCAIQLWSILENASSENGKTWAKTLQKIMVNKAQRHFDIKLDDLKGKEEEKDNG